MMNPHSDLRAMDDPLTLASVFQALRRRRQLIVWPMLALLAAAGVSCFFATSRYRATTEIQVLKADGGAFGLESTVTGQDGGAAAGDSLDYNMTLQTEAGILRSPALALAVIKAMQLERTPDYFASAHAGSSFLPARWMALILGRKPLEPLSVPLENAPNRRYVAEKIFKSHLKVQPLAGTRLLDISYTDRDPQRAAEVANACTRVLSEMDFQQRLTATLQGSSWLSGQLEELRTHTEQAQARAAVLQRGTGVFGNDASRNVVLERLDSLNQTLTAAESNRILKESIDKVASSASPELISSLSGNSSAGSVASINTSLSLIQGLRQQESQVRAELAEASVRYGPAYPKVAELKAQLDGVTASTAAETARLGQRAHTDWLIALREEQAARAAFERQKQLAMEQNDSVISYQLARQEADSSRDLYEGLLSKLKQASVLQGLRSSNISVVSPAEMPPPNRPSSPNVPMRLAAAAAAGLLFGLGAAGYRELTDDSIHSIAQLKTLCAAPVLGVLPSFSRASINGVSKSRRWLGSGPTLALAAARDPRPSMPVAVLEQKTSVYTEQLRALRTTLLSVSGDRTAPKVILVTSCGSAEGKTTLSFNLATLLALGGSRVLLVDADLRRPALQRYRAEPRDGGFAFALSGPGAVAPHAPFAHIPNLLMLADAEAPPMPAELLSSPRLPELIQEWRADYDMVVLDSPPVLPVTDAVLLARHSDAVVVVARHQQTTQATLCRGVELLQTHTGVDVPVGVVLNQVCPSGEFREYFGSGEMIYAI